MYIYIRDRRKPRKSSMGSFSNAGPRYIVSYLNRIGLFMYKNSLLYRKCSSPLS